MKGPHGAEIAHGSGNFSEIFRYMLGFLATSIYDVESRSLSRGSSNVYMTRG